MINHDSNINLWEMKVGKYQNVSIEILASDADWVL